MFGLLLFARLAAAEPLSVADAIAAARAHQPAAAAASARADSADARADLSRAALLPSASGSAVWAARPDGTGVSVGARADQLLFDYRTWRSWSSARTAADASARDVDSVLLAVELDVRLAYYGVLATKQLVAVADDAVGNAELHLDQVSAFIEVQARPEIDRAQAKTDVANARVERIRADTDHQLARAALADAMATDLTGYDPIDALPAPVTGEEGGLDALITEAFANRPDLQAASARLTAAKTTWSAAHAGAMPALSASASIGDTIGSAPGPAVSVSVGATWPILQGGATIARSDIAAADIAIAESDLASGRLGVRLAVETAWRSVAADVAALSAADDAVEAATARLALASGRYAEGAGSALEESDARLALTRARAQRVRTAYDLAADRARLLYALGRVSP